MEPPSQILTDLNYATEPESEDPLSKCIYMIFNDESSDEQDGYFVCAYSALTGFSYIGKAGLDIS